MSIIGYIWPKKKPHDVVVFQPSNVEGESTYGEFYAIHICPRCKHKLHERQARYYSRCCYLCGHSNGYLFNTQSVIVRDRFVNGEYVETIVHSVVDDD